jgi:hypothetical protein
LLGLQPLVRGFARSKWARDPWCLRERRGSTRAGKASRSTFPSPWVDGTGWNPAKIGQYCPSASFTAGSRPRSPSGGHRNLSADSTREQTERSVMNSPVRRVPTARGSPRPTQRRGRRLLNNGRPATRRRTSPSCQSCQKRTEFVGNPTVASYVLIPGAGGMAWYWHRVVGLSATTRVIH